MECKVFKDIDNYKKQEKILNTSKIKIRPFIPKMKDEHKEGREEFATLSYGNITIEIDYTLIHHVCCVFESHQKANALFNTAIKEIIKEMHYEMDGELPKHHRDTCTNYTLSIAHNPLHPINDEIEYITLPPFAKQSNIKCDELDRFLSQLD